MSILKSKIELRFYKESSGREPVRTWLRKLETEDRRTIGKNIRTVQTDWPVSMPLVGPFGKGLWEIRSSLTNREARIIFIIYDGKLVLLHGFIKKTQTTPPSDLKLAQERSIKVKKGQAL